MAQRTVAERGNTSNMRDREARVGREADVAVFESVEPSRPMDRVRWGAVLAGLMTALSTLVLLSVLGLAIGLTTFEPGDELGNFGMGAGIWGAISTIIAFLLGGWVAARSAALRGRDNALLNGAMVWAVAIPLIMYLLGSGIGSVINVASDAVATSASVLSEEVDAADATAAADTVQAQVEAIDPATVENATENAGEAAWGTLVALLVGLAAATVGGLMGERKELGHVRTAVVT